MTVDFCSPMMLNLCAFRSLPGQVDPPAIPTCGWRPCAWLLPSPYQRWLQPGRQGKVGALCVMQGKFAVSSARMIPPPPPLHTHTTCTTRAVSPGHENNLWGTKVSFYISQYCVSLDDPTSTGQAATG